MTAFTTESDSGYQLFPESGSLFGNMNLDKQALTQRIAVMEATVYCYVVTTVKYNDGRFAQTGSGPNFEGGLITLCTCKGLMRTGKDLDAWGGIWIAGITRAETGHHGKGYLFYLMRVGRAFESHRDLWTWLLENTLETAEAKAADQHRLGDVYRPKHPFGNLYDPDAYVSPCPDHIHRPRARYKEDIDYVGYGHRRSALLVGDPQYSFLWSKPRVPVPFRVGRGCKKASLDELLPEPDEAGVL